MRFRKVLLVNPRISGSYMGPIRPPASLGYLAQSLGGHNIPYDIIDMNLGYGLKHLYKKIESLKPDLVGVTVWSYRYKDTYDLIRAVKNRYPQLSIVAGGPHISSLRMEALKVCNQIDFGVVLEGEDTLVELCQGAPLDGIKGLIYRKGEGLIYTGDRGFNAALDSLPFPRYDKFEIKKYFLKEVLIISSRGCPFNCIFCPVNLAIGKKLRIRNANNVVDEIEYWYNMGYRQFNIGDDNFTFFKDRVYEICEGIERRRLADLDIRCGNGIRADRVDRDLLKRMKEVGFSYLGLGVEGGNNRILQRLKKGESIEEIETTIKDACHLGYDVTLFFLAGSPGEGISDINDSVRLAERYPVIDARFYNIIPYPSTELFEWVDKNNLFLRKPEDYLNDTSAFSLGPVFETPELSAGERVKVLKRLQKVEKRILRKGLKRKLRRYGLFGTLMALTSSFGFLHFIMRHNKIMRRIGERVRYSLNQS